MDVLSLTVGGAMIFVALLLIGTAVPMAMGRTRRNRWYGVRLTGSLASDDAWDAVNRYGGRQFIYAAVPVLIAGVVLLLIPLTPRPALTLISPAVTLTSILVATVRTVIYDAAYTERISSRP